MEFILQLDKILSFNDYLKAGVKKGRRGHYAYLYMDPDVRKYKNGIKSQIIKNYKSVILESDLFTSSNKYRLEWDYYVTNIDKIDVSNINKICEDSIFDGINEVLKSKKLKINDVQVRSYSATKHELTGLVETIKCKFYLVN